MNLSKTQYPMPRIKSILLLACLLCYTSAQAIWLSLDPLSDKSPYISPYAYCAWNPIKYVDPDGREKIIALSRADLKTPSIKSAALKFPDNRQVIHLWAHGNSNGVEIGSPDYDDVSFISSPEVFYDFLMNQSEIWQLREEKKATILVLHSCSTGSGNNSFAEQISSSPLFENVIIVAPSTNIIIINKQEYGPADMENTNNIGLWNMFLNGELVNSFNGTTAPIFSEPAKHLDKYKSETE